MRTGMKALALASAVVVALMMQTGCTGPTQVIDNTRIIYVDSTGDTTVQYPDELNTLSFHGLYLGMDSIELKSVVDTIYQSSYSNDTSFHLVVCGSDTVEVLSVNDSISHIRWRVDGYDIFAKDSTNFTVDAILNYFPQIDVDDIKVTDTAITFTNEFGLPPYNVTCSLMYSDRPRSAIIDLIAL